ncbi:hypothetical protein ABH940_006863 [Streptacidiphilus sp. BW17]|uniref:DUF4365 domain-containing protein n=1 Tax=Streptacidiphilus sp. BW17 TaxID=3156274 RepID=UPI0035155671
MAKVSSRRRIERAGVNALRSLLEEHDHLVQEIDGGADHGEDLYVAVVREGRRTGHVVAVQVKSGQKYARARGYAIPVDDHREDWKQSRIPVIGVVYDLDRKQLFWTNLTQELRTGNDANWIHIPRTNELSRETIDRFITAVEVFGSPQASRSRAEGLGGWAGVTAPDAAGAPGHRRDDPRGVGTGPGLAATVAAQQSVVRVITVKGILGSINFDGHTVSIRKDGFGPRMKGVQTIPVVQIERVIVKAATSMVHGYIQFVTRHQPPASDRRLSAAFGRPHREDPDSMSFPRRANEEIIELKTAIDNAAEQARRSSRRR